ncbi:RNA polymerase sigma factor RpoD [Microcoleus sp. FACHB-SPT15]|nr:RNA polymerase sigma factor RpoD [Microcoleus sp. FACHB-SPT15]
MLHVEASVFHLELGYWGKVDCIVQLDGVICLIDWKTADKAYQQEQIHEHKIQCAAYMEAVNKTYGLSLKHALIVIALRDQAAQIFQLEPEVLNQHFQEWQQRVRKFRTILPTPGTIITNPDGSTFRVQSVPSLSSVLKYRAINFQPSLQQANSSFTYPVQTKKKFYTEDSIRLYLQEISCIQLLRADEEIELARKIADLLELERVRERLFDQLEREPEDSEWATEVNMSLPAFRRRLYLGYRAKDKMVESNLRLVVSIAKKYMNRGVSFPDLIQEGSLGLIRATEKFDHEKGYKFSTYATWWIRQAITRALSDQSRTIRLPIHLYETISRIKKSTKILYQEMHRKPTEEEIADRMEMSIEKLRFIAEITQLPISLETPIPVDVEKDPWFDGKDTQEYLCLGDLIEADDETAEDKVSKNLLREDLESVLDTLSPCERDVVRLRYGLDDGNMKTLEEIGQIFNVNREQIRQVEAKALRKLRHPARNSILKDYIQGINSCNSIKNGCEERSEVNQNYTKVVENAENEL